MNMSDMRAARKGTELLLAWKKERDVLFPEVLEADVSLVSSLGPDSQEEISHIWIHPSSNYMQRYILI
jgi:hypothetical protein